MKHICSGCGSEIPEGNDFCYVCGAWTSKAFAINDEGTILYSSKCVNCGKELVPGAEFCAYCGSRTSDSNIPISSRQVGGKLSNKDLAAILLAVIPGLFNIFGLGQLIQKRWSKAFVYISTTILLFYITPSLITSTSGFYIALFLQVGFFFISVMDVFKSVARRGA
ncbi:MAG: zinc ribbon domain-containing protein [Candidatus Methanomethylophilaceae archaeon]|nr:zinc ribbon domain-containing protein [Candidatus Methanomethylophilaceae archaeon]